MIYLINSLIRILGCKIRLILSISQIVCLICYNRDKFLLIFGRKFFRVENMFLKGIYAGKPAVVQLTVLLLLVLAGAVFSSLFAMCLLFLAHVPYAEISRHADMMRVLQLLSAIGTFLLPAWGLAWLCSDDPKGFLSAGKRADARGGRFANRSYGIVLVSVMLLSPAITLVGLWNKQMELPAFMAPVENWMRAQEEAAEAVTSILLAGEGITTLLFNLIVIAAAAGITEEFLFRGALQRVIGRWTHNHHIAIWSTAAAFSAFHMQFFGFLPRMLLGAYFGYLLYWSRNIWLPVFAHFVNNAFAVISLSNAQLKDNEFITGDLSTDHLLPYTLVAIAALFAFAYCCREVKRVRSRN